VFGDQVIASAILDRLLHHSITINIKGESFRLKEKLRAGLLKPKTHQSTTDPEAAGTQEGRQRGQAQLRRPCADGESPCVAVNDQVMAAHDRAERQAAIAMIEKIPGHYRVTLGADKGYDTKEFVQQLSDHQVTPHLARKVHQHH
jgi:IstB-like ATP binding protein